MKAVVVTTQNAINYGAVLQSYALYKFISKMGVDTELLNLKRKSKLYFIPLDMTSMQNFASGIYNNAIRLQHILAIYEKEVRFKTFVQNYIKTTPEYEKISDVMENPPEADLFITGGDQMFNCHSGVNDVSFLGFGDEAIKRISYSTSMGIHEVPHKYLKKFTEMLNRYEVISLREKSAKDYIDKHCNVRSTINIDPVFLLTKSQWLEIIAGQKPIIDRPYILVYQLLYNPLTMSIIRRLRAETGLMVVAISPNARNYIEADRVIRNAGPIEFLNLFAHARSIVTTSFHGTCFSVIFEKQFFSLINDKAEVRINALLKMLNLTQRIVTDVDRFNNDEIDYRYVEHIVENERRCSNEYLQKFLRK